MIIRHDAHIARRFVLSAGEEGAEGATGGGSMSMAEGVAALVARHAPEEPKDETEQQAPETGADDATETEQQESQAEPTAEDSDAAPETDTGEADAESEPEQPTLSPPARWDADMKALFAALSPEMQRKLVDRDKTQQAAITKAQQEAAEARKRAEADTQIKDRLNTALTRAEQTFRGKWDGIDWQKWAQEAPEKAAAARLQFDLEREQLHELQAAQHAEQQKAYSAFIEAEETRLRDLDPELADPEKGKERRAEVGQYLIESGVPADALSNISAVELVIARKAMRYDRAQAAMSEPLKPKITASPPVKPAGARGGNNSNQHLESLNKRLTTSGKPSDAVALYLAQKRAKG